MSDATLLWTILIGVVAAMLVVDLLTLRGRVSLRSAVAWNIVWLGLGLAFTAPVWALDGRVSGQEYLAGYLLERSLSLDNVFVFAVIFAYFAVPLDIQPRALLWGIAGALVLRAIFIVIGAGLLATLHWMIYVFGAFLVITAIRLALTDDESVDPSRNVALRLLRRVVPLSDRFEGTRLTVHRGGVLMATPMVAVLAVLATTDLLFAVDSIPAIFAVTDDLFIVFAANAFSVLGLRAMYFLLADMMGRFEYLKYGLAAVLATVGAKMLLSDIWHVPIWLTLLSIVVLIGGAVLISLVLTSDAKRPGPPGRPRPVDEKTKAGVS